MLNSGATEFIDAATRILVSSTEDNPITLRVYTNTPDLYYQLIATPTVFRFNRHDSDGWHTYWEK